MGHGAKIKKFLKFQVREIPGARQTVRPAKGVQSDRWKSCQISC